MLSCHFRHQIKQKLRQSQAFIYHRHFRQQIKQKRRQTHVSNTKLNKKEDKLDFWLCYLTSSDAELNKKEDKLKLSVIADISDSKLNKKNSSYDFGCNNQLKK